MKIAFLGYHKPTSRFNGVATVILQQTQWLEEHGHTVLHYHLFSKEEYRNLSNFLIDNKVDIAVWHMTSFKVHLNGKLPCPLICLYHSNPNVVDPEYYTKFIAKYHIPLFIKKLLSVKFLSSVLNFIHFLYYQLFFVYITSKANRMVLLSKNYITDFFAAKIFPSKVISISNSCDMPFIENEIERSKTVVFLGRLHNEHKGVDMLLRIWGKIEKEFIDWRLLVCGDGPDRDVLLEYARFLRLERVDFQGFTPPRFSI